MCMNKESTYFVLVSGECEEISTSPELMFNTSTNGSTTSGKYTCVVNYTLSGESSHKCQADSSWDYPIPACGNIAQVLHVLHVAIFTMMI